MHVKCIGVICTLQGMGANLCMNMNLDVVARLPTFFFPFVVWILRMFCGGCGLYVHMTPKGHTNSIYILSKHPVNSSWGVNSPDFSVRV